MTTALVNAQAPLYSSVAVSDVGTSNSIGNANSSRNVVVDNSGNLYIVFYGSNGIRVAKSTNRGQSFLPSVQVSTEANEAEIAISSNGTIHVSWQSPFTSQLMISSSSNSASSFSTPTSLGGFGNSPHMATYGNMVYVLTQNGSTLYVNNANGVGAFTQTAFGGFAFSDVFADPTNGDVYVVADSPTVFLFKSTNSGASFSPIALSLGAYAYYSSYALSLGPLGKFLFVGGGNLGGTSGTDGFKINLSTGTTTPITLMNSPGDQSRTLIADEFGNFVDGYKTGGSVDFRISYDQGITWQAPVSVATANTHNLARNQVYQDVVVVYQIAGQIYANVYGAALPGGTVNSFIVGQNCGATVSNLAVTIKTPPVSGTTTYRFRLTNTVTTAVQIINRPVNSFALSNLVGVTLGTQYQIEVSTDLGVTYGAPCIVRTPSPLATIGAQCGTTLSTMGQWIYASYFSAVTGYRFKVTNTVTNAVEIYDAPSGLNKFNFNQLPSSFRTLATIYSVEVALRNTDGTYLPYGASCNITTPSPFITREVERTNEFVAITYPNPFVENFMFDVTTTVESNIEIRVYDMLGRQVENRNVEASDINNLQFGDAYPSGVYNVVVSQGANTQTLRVIKR